MVLDRVLEIGVAQHILSKKSPKASLSVMLVSSIHIDIAELNEHTHALSKSKRKANEIGDNNVEKKNAKSSFSWLKNYKHCDDVS